VKKSLIRCLEIGPTHSIPLDHRESVYVNVTLIDANHCPGAVMFLFEGYFGSILYTADFRVHRTMLDETLPVLLSEKTTGKRRGVDVLYLDNTYCDPRCSFPTQRDATNWIVELMKNHRSEDPRTEFIIGMRALGKETLLEEIALSLETHVVVDLNRMGQLELLECRNVFTTNPDEGFVHVLNFKQVTRKMVAQWNEVQPTIAILPTALFNGLYCDPYQDDPNIFTVPYSDHSSYVELLDFVQFVRPKKVLPIVKNSSHDSKAIGDMARFDPYLDPEPAQAIIIPDEVQRILKGHKVRIMYLVLQNNSGMKYHTLDYCLKD
jgi:DNA cross-link repair 1B protein